MVNTIGVDESACTKCGLCVSACPIGIFRQASADVFPETGGLASCISCGHCAAICPVGAVNHSGFPEGSIHAVTPSDLPSKEQALNMLRMRRSIRVFQKKPVERELVNLIIEGAKFAPTGHNIQNVEYVVVQDPSKLEELKKITAEFYANMVKLLKNPAMLDSLPAPMRDTLTLARPSLPLFELVDNGIKAGRDPVLRGASNILVFHTVKRPLDVVNSTLALENAMLMCSSMGLGSFYLGFLQLVAERDPRIQKALGIPDGHGIYGAIAFGYPEYTFNKWMDKRPAKVTWIT